MRIASLYEDPAAVSLRAVGEARSRLAARGTVIVNGPFTFQAAAADLKDGWTRCICKPRVVSSMTDDRFDVCG